MSGYSGGGGSFITDRPTKAGPQSSGLGVRINSPGPLGTFGAWTTVFTTTGVSTKGLAVNIFRESINAIAFQLAIGPAGSEQILLGPLVIMDNANAGGHWGSYVDLAVPAGTRISAAIATASSVGADQALVCVSTLV